MKDYVFVCIGTNKLITDSFGPRVGEKLKRDLADDFKVQIFGTMQKPIHFKNAKILLEQLSQKQKEQVILIDSAFGERENIGETYVNIGGMEIGKAYGKGFYFPALFNIKTIVGNKNEIPNWNVKKIDLLAEKVANQIIQIL